MIDSPEPLCKWGLPCPAKMLLYSLIYQCLILNMSSFIPIGANCLLVHSCSPIWARSLCVRSYCLSQIFMSPYLLTVWAKSLWVCSYHLSQIFMSPFLPFEPNLYEPVLTIWAKSLRVHSYHLSKIFMSLFLPFEQNLYVPIFTIWANSLCAHSCSPLCCPLFSPRACGLVPAHQHRRQPRQLGVEATRGKQRRHPWLWHWLPEWCVFVVVVVVVVVIVALLSSCFFIISFSFSSSYPPPSDPDITIMVDSKNDAGELGWRCSTSSTMVMSPSTPATCQNH